MQIAATISSQREALTGQALMSIKIQVPGGSYELIPVEIVFDPSNPLGIYVTVDGIKNQMLAEMARRGGFLSICGKIWAQSNEAQLRVSNTTMQLGSNLTDPFERLVNI